MDWCFCSSLCTVTCSHRNQKWVHISIYLFMLWNKIFVKNKQTNQQTFYSFVPMIVARSLHSFSRVLETLNLLPPTSASKLPGTFHQHYPPVRVFLSGEVFLWYFLSLIPGLSSGNAGVKDKDHPRKFLTIKIQLQLKPRHCLIHG